MSAVLDAEDIRVAYGGVEAVLGVSLSVARGSIATVIGPNGAGKTTLLGALMGVLPARGRVRFNGASVNHLGVEARAEAGMALVPESRALFATMSVEDNLRLGGFRLRRAGRAAARARLDAVLALFPRLSERRRQAAGTLSGGERQMLAMGRALMGEPALLMLDEPSLGLAPLIVRDIFATIARLRAEGVAILLVEQNARAALEIADHGYVLENGAVTAAGGSRELARDPRVIAAYLGSDSSDDVSPSRPSSPAGTLPPSGR
ncbi:MAG: ABC transporter ATP-binding protein [Proteobacteria bacterium]|nr:ABC transporter ATP-binding protein [Pseudomonadota bacterium]